MTIEEKHRFINTVYAIAEPSKRDVVLKRFDLNI